MNATSLPKSPRRGMLVDQLGARRLELAQRSLEIRACERDVMHAGAATREKAADRRVGAGRSEQLDAALADEERHRLDPLGLERAAMLDDRPEQPLVRRDRLVEILDGDAEMMDPADAHSRDASRCVRDAPASLVAHRQRAHRAHRLRRARLWSHVAEQSLELGAVERLLLEQRLGDTVERERCLASSRCASSYA